MASSCTGVEKSANPTDRHPFDIKLFGDNRLVVLSGPNAGNKSVALKSVGLLQLMVQNGIPVRR